jgi:hypothetical protein
MLNWFLCDQVLTVCFCRLSQLETELDRTRGSSNGLEASLRVAENALADANVCTLLCYTLY